MNNKLLSLLLILFACSLVVLPAGEEDYFPIPDIIKNNVTFWVKIFSEVSDKDGLIHDEDYPLIIYKKIPIGKRSGRNRSNYLKSQFNKVKRTLAGIQKKKENKWSKEENRIADLFRKYASLKKLSSARHRLRFQQGVMEMYKDGLERSGAYLDYIKEVFEEYGIPERIAYLPHVESSFNYKARSKVGAYGMWQFMRGTGRIFMKIDYKLDERRDPFAATVAAAKLLRKNFEELKSWPLAITAYNHGLASMKRAVRTTGSRDIEVILRIYSNRRFKFASKNFYSSFLAASKIAEDPDAYFTDLDVASPIRFNLVTLDSFIRPATLVKYLGVPQEELARLNLALQPNVFSRKELIPKGYQLKIPVSLTAEKAATLLADIPKKLKFSKDVGLRYYRVRKGDSLIRISKKFGVSTRDIKQINRIARNNVIYIGQLLKIPPSRS